MQTTDPVVYDAVAMNATFVRLLELGTISVDECFYNILSMTFAADEATWNDCIGVMPASLRSQFVDFVRHYLLPVDFMPEPGVILPPPRTPEAVAATKERRRPRYMRLLKLVENAYSS